MPRHMMNKELKKKLMDCQKLLKKNPLDPYLLYYKGSILSELGFYESAIEAYDLSLLTSPLDIDVLLAKGKTLFKVKRYSEALIVYNQILDIEPKNLEAKRNKKIALANVETEILSQKLKNYEDSLKTNSKDSELFYKSGNILFRLNRYGEG